MKGKEAARFEVAVGGIGGQGSLIIGKMLAEAGLSKYKNITYFPNYGAAMRGGSSECTVILSDGMASSPIGLEIQVGIVMHQQFLQAYEKMVRPGGFLLTDSTMVAGKAARKDINTLYLPTTKTAISLGDKKVANIVLLGAYIEATKALPLEAIEKALAKKLGANEKMMQLNRKALEEGARLVANYDKQKN